VAGIAAKSVGFLNNKLSSRVLLLSACDGHEQ